MKPTLNMFCLLCWLSSATAVLAQRETAAPWISFPTANQTQYGVYHFRKSFELAEMPAALPVQVSADNRYELFVNGERVSFGPAKGDLITYKYDELDIAPFLRPGKNVLAALVFNMGADKPMAFLSVQTAFMLRSPDSSFVHLTTDQSWKTYRNEAYDPISYRELATWQWVRGYYACGPGDEVFADKYPWGWESLDYNDKNWLTPEVLTFDRKAPWNLVPRNIAFMDTHREAPAHIRRLEGIRLPSAFVINQQKLLVPANTQAKVLFDFENFTMGYPELTLNKGRGATVKVRYAEALYEKPDLKAHRDSVDTLAMYGVFDIYHTDGAQHLFRPLWKRAFRYVELEVTTGSQSLEILSLDNQYSGYPYPDMGTFVSNNEQLNEIFQMSLRTLRMCSGETFYDTPYYEQLSYGGDNRPIAGNYVYNTTDDRLLREAIRLLPQSANVETRLFKSAYPSRFDFDMGTWSMAWVQSLWDYYQLRGDSAFVAQFLPPIEGVLDFHRAHLDESMGLLGPIHTRNFIDWSAHQGSVPQDRPREVLTHSAMLSLYYAHTLDCAVQLYRHFGKEEKADEWERVSAGLKTAVYVHCWDAKKQLLADYPDRQQFSQHTNILAILCDVVSTDKQRALLDRLLVYPQFDEIASSYFSFFLFKAMQKTGREDLFLQHLDFWEQFVDKGFTTCGETGFASHDRSDCHAWSAHPSYFLLSSVCGIKPADIGFHKVLIEPHLGRLTQVEASMPHPTGRIRVSYAVAGGQFTARIVLPQGMQGTFSYGGNNFPLQTGENFLELEKK